ncbi:MAG: tRNA (5-methylaminomethyl-2-thiouridine)(34)-methyltransferase MnmD, partial [Pseudomonadota bacterium]
MDPRSRATDRYRTGPRRAGPRGLTTGAMTMEDAELIAPAALSWRKGQPYAEAFQDIYHDQDGIGEVERVFLAPAGLPEGLKALKSLRVGELGFGTALNFAVLARHCLAAGVRLDFVTVEAAPVAPADFFRIAAERETREPLYRELKAAYPPLLRGWHRRSLASGRITLHAFWGDGATGLKELEAASVAPMNLWLLDGFAPDRNPALWADELLASVGRLSGRGTSVTTFSAAGRVRRALAKAGFKMRRVDQRPHKRESLAGIMEAGGEQRPPPALVHVIGAGIAGAATARRLAERGISVIVSDARIPAAGASAIPVTVMHPRLHHDGSGSARLKALAYLHALGTVAPYLEDAESGLRRAGALQVPSPNYPIERLEAVADRYGSTGLALATMGSAEAAAAFALVGFTLPERVLHFADACLVDTPRFTRVLLDHPKIELRGDCSEHEWPDAPTVLACG